MSKIFDTFDVDYDSVSFRYTASGVKDHVFHKKHVFIDKPVGVSVTQWTDFWYGVKGLYGGDPSPNEAEFMETIKELEEQISSLENDVSELEADDESLKEEILDLASDNEALRSELEELRYRLESLDK